VIKHQIGSIAQDWLAHFPELVVEPETPDQYYGLDYDRIGVVALGAVKELHALVARKDAEIEALKGTQATLEQRLTRLETTEANRWNSAGWLLLAPLGLVGFAFYRRL